MIIDHFQNSTRIFVTDPVTDTSVTRNEFYDLVQEQLRHIKLHGVMTEAFGEPIDLIQHIPTANSVSAMVNIIAHYLAGSCIQLEPPDSNAFEEMTTETGFDLVIGSSGSTGRGRRIKLTWASGIENSHQMTLKMKLNEDNVHMLLMPLHHVNSLFYSFLSSVIVGQHIVMPSKVNLLQFWSLVKKYNIRSVNVSPAIVRQLNTRPAPAEHTLTQVLSASSALSKVDLDRFYNLTGIEIIQGYGLSEATNFSTVMPADSGTRKAVNKYFSDAPRLSIGNALPGHHIKLSAQNEIMIKSPSNFVGYINEQPPDSNWVYTGDLGYYKSYKGKVYWFIRGRTKEIIKYRDNTLYPLDVEQWIQNQIKLPMRFFCFGFENYTDVESIGMIVDSEDWSTELENEVVNLRNTTYSYYPRLVLIGPIDKYLTATKKPQRIKIGREMKQIYQNHHFGQKIIVETVHDIN